MDLRSVLCPIDFTPLSERAVELAGAVCQRFGARLVLEHNLDPRPPTFLSVTWMWSEDRKQSDDATVRAAEERLRGLLARLPATLPREAKLTRGPMDLGLIEIAQSLPADLIVMGSHGWSNTQHRSLTELILDGAPCPVLTLTEASAGVHFIDAAAAPIPVLVPVDLSSHSRTTVSNALQLLDRLPLALHLLHIEEPPFERGNYEEDRRRLEALVPEALRDQVRFHIRSGEASDEILTAARDFDARLILMGCHPKGSLERFFTGATARDILHRATCPVWFEPATRARAVSARVSA